ncbi:MAG: ABC transporter transmembrane domain-containing protein, partial [Ilumatobacteraceae bacterium]
MTAGPNAPLDPALLRRAPALARHLVVAAIAAATLAIVTVAQAEILARAISQLVAHPRHDDQGTAVVALLAIGAVRAVSAWVVERSAGRTMATIRLGMRSAVLAHAAADADRTTPGLAAREATVATAGIDRLEPYVRDYLPALCVAVTVPLAAGLRILSVDWISAAIVVVTVPLIPVFMVLIGLMTEQRTQRQWAMLQRLSGHFLDVMEGLPTLRLFGRARAQAEQVRSVADRYRGATMRTLRVAFLSAFALELLATRSVAVIAVEIGLRMANGAFGLHDGLVVLLLAPECYLPLRRVGAGFHAAQAGRDAAADLDQLLERRSLTGGDRPIERVDSITVRALDVDRAGRPGLLGELELDLRPGEVTAVVGPSGTGKSTTIAALRGRLADRRGDVVVH